MARETAVVTGASRGIGRAVALDLAARGYDVVATMRDPAAGADLVAESGGRVHVARLDVEDPATIELPDDLAVLVNNAGVECAYLPVEHAPMSDWRSVFEVNVFGLVEVTRRALPLLRANGGGVVCNVTSSATLVPMPFYAVYRASKAAVSALTESLRSELAPFGIRVVEVMPGPIDTDMLAASARLPEAAAHDGYSKMAERAHAGRLGVDDMTTSTADAARAIVDAIEDPGAPLKVGCDPLGTGLIEAWTSAPVSLLGMRV